MSDEQVKNLFTELTRTMVACFGNAIESAGVKVSALADETPDEDVAQIIVEAYELAFSQAVEAIELFSRLPELAGNQAWQDAAASLLATFGTLGESLQEPTNTYVEKLGEITGVINDLGDLSIPNNGGTLGSTKLGKLLTGSGYALEAYLVLDAVRRRDYSEIWSGVVMFGAGLLISEISLGAAAFVGIAVGVSWPFVLAGAGLAYVIDKFCGGKVEEFFQTLYGNEEAAFVVQHYTRLYGGSIMHFDSVDALAQFGTPNDDVNFGLAGHQNLIGGGAGSDYLRGADGNDILGGGADSDRLEGLSGDDQLLGDTGNDILNGGEGADLLMGGQGFDEYRFVDSDFANSVSSDTIVDSDGQGKITFGGIAIGDYSVNNVSRDGLGWSTTDGLFRLQVLGTGAERSLVLVHRASGNQVIVKNWTNGGLGITLPGLGEPGTPENPLPQTNGDDLVGRDGDTDPGTIVSGDQFIQGLAGNDGIDGGYGDDWIDGGHDDDLIFGGAGDDEIHGGLGDDIIVDRSQAMNWRKVIEPGNDQTNFWNTIIGDAKVYSHGDGWWAEVNEGETITGNATDRLFSLRIGALGWYGEPTFVQLDPALHPSGNDVIDAGEGSDTVYAGAGNDTIDGGIGNDLLIGGEDSDSIEGGEDDDLILGDLLFVAGSSLSTSINPSAATAKVDGNDILVGGEGNDRVYGQGGSDTISGGAGNDLLLGDRTDFGLQYAFESLGATGNDYIDGGDGDDQIFGNAGNDTLLGGAGIDSIQGDDVATAAAAQGNDYIDAGEGNDTVWGGGGYDVIRGGEGNDTLSGDYDPSQLALANHGNDTIFGDAGNDTLIGDGGNDYLDGGADDDLMDGKEGDDQLIGGTGVDQLVGGLGNDGLDGGAGNDKLWGGEGEDLLRGGEGNDELQGDAGNDSLDGGSGIDLLRGSAGNDRLNGGEGSDYLYGDSGAEVGNDQLNGGNGDDALWGGNGNDLLNGDAGDDHLHGGAGDDVLTGGSGNDQLYGEYGSDKLYGNEGNDTLNDGEELYGGDGDDRLNSGGGVVRYVGGAGADTLWGDHASDIYVYGRGDGFDLIYNGNYNPYDTDIIEFTGGLTPEDVRLQRDGNHLYVVTDNSANQICIVDYFSSSSGILPIASMKFEDGTVWTSSDITARIPVSAADSFTDTAGDDTFTVDDSGDTIVANPGGGIDTVESYVTYTLPADIENMTALGILNIGLYGNESNNALTGNAGNNYINGYGGADIGIGGAGNDTYSSVETVIELENGGKDKILFRLEDYHLGYTIPDNVEELQISASACGGNYLINGNSTDNTFWITDPASAQAPFALSFDGKQGADRYVYTPAYYAGGRNITIYIDNVGDTWEFVGTQYAAFNLVSSLNTDFTFNGLIREFSTAGSSSISVYGNASDNIIKSNVNLSSNTSVGGLGDDEYVIGANDSVVESAGGGIDKVVLMDGSGTVYHAQDNIENIVVTGTQFTEVRGNDLDNVISGRGSSLYGSNGNDVITGTTFTGSSQIIDGGAGADTMAGDGNAQIYYVDNVLDTITENYAGYDLYSNDKVVSSIDYVLSANLENLDLIGDARNATGNARRNTIVGNGHDNVISSGAGSDRLFGMGGADTYVFNKGEFLKDIYETANTAGENDALRFGAGIGPGDISARKMPGADVLQIVVSETVGGTTQIIGYAYIQSYSGASGVEKLEFADGTVLNVDDLVQDNSPPTIGATLEAQEMIEGQYFVLALPEDLFLDGPDDQLAITFDFSKPWWLAYDEATRTLAGTPPDGAGSGSFGITATDSWGESVSTTFDYAVLNAVLGSGDNDSLNGTSGRDAMFGYEGDDTLNGDGGADRLVGSYGDDTYIVDDAGDVVLEQSEGEGNDLVNASISYTLGNQVERLTLTGTDATNGTGNELANIIAGNSAPNVLEGLDGDDTLDGKGGADTLNGGNGNDSYTVDNTADVIVELAGAGMDSVSASATYTLSSDVEKLTLTGTAAIHGTGNAQDNVITGNSGANTLTGIGGNDTLDGKSGADTLIGGAGDDTYVVDNANDSVQEVAGEGIDSVQSSLAHTLANNVENLTITGTGTLAGTGNTLNNVLVGGSGSNSLSGLAGNDTLEGKAGTDTLTGGAGNDTYQMARTYGSDTVVENDATAGVIDVAGFLSGVTYDQLWFKRPSSSNNLEIIIIGTTDKLVIKDWYLGTQYRVEEIRTVDGNKVLQAANVQALVNAMAGMTQPAQGQTTLTPAQRTTLDPVFASTWQNQTLLMGGQESVMTGGNQQSVATEQGGIALQSESAQVPAPSAVTPRVPAHGGSIGVASPALVDSGEMGQHAPLTDAYVLGQQQRQRERYLAKYGMTGSDNIAELESLIAAMASFAPGASMSDALPADHAANRHSMLMASPL